MDVPSRMTSTPTAVPPNIARRAQAINVSVLGVWLGALITTGAAAAIIFSTAKPLAPTIPSMSAYTGEHWRLLGGQIASKIFFVTDIVQFVCAGLAIVSLGLLAIFGRAHIGRIHLGLRVITLSAALSVLMYHLFVLQPRMSVSLREYWDAASAGDNAKAQSFKAKFDADHPTASTTLIATASLVLISLAFAAWPMRPDAATKKTTE